MLESSIDLNSSIMLLVETWAKCRSKDPNTKVGACVYDPDSGTMYFGYNGFARGVTDSTTRWQRPIKYEYVIHAEDNAIIKALRGLGNLSQCIMYCTHKPCHKCMSKIIQVGIKTIYYHTPHDDSKITDELAAECAIGLYLI